jgi:hypothetical protein
MKLSTTANSLKMRVGVVSPPRGVLFAMQRGKSGLLAPTSDGGNEVWFEFALRIGAPQADHSVNFLGELTQGPRSDRFLYINSGVRAAQPTSCWDRRAKLKLAFIPQDLLERVTKSGGVIEARFPGTAADGGPVCATIPPGVITWRWQP